MPTYNSRLTWKVRDETGVERSFNTHAEMTVDTFADMEAALDAITTVLDAPITGRIVDCEVTLLGMAGGTIKSAPQAGSNIADGATISFRDSAGNANPFWLPTVDASKYDGRVLDLDDTEISAVVARFFPGANVSGTANIDFTDEDNRKYVSVPPKAAIKGFRSSRKP